MVAISAVAILLFIGVYIFQTRGKAADPSDPAAVAASNAEAALAASGMSAKDRAATEAVVRAYILEHPEIITEAVGILQQREAVKRLEAVAGDLQRPFPGAESGNPKGDVTLVEFTDYSCGYCRASVPELNRLVREDPNVRIVYRELPILSAESREAALWALAAAKQGKHKAFHDAMFAGDRPSPQSIRVAAQAAGLNIASAEAFVKSKDAVNEVNRNLSMMQQIGFTGTPTFIVGNEILEGAHGYEALKAAVEKTRKKA